MRFSDVINQSKIKEQLISTVAENRVSHAQLFLGPEGCGNLAMALAYAQYINCENKHENDSCGECRSCTKAQKLIHPDIHFTFPFVNTDKKEKCSEWMVEWREFVLKNSYSNYNEWIQQITTDNKQGNINAKECTDIIHRLSFKTFESTYKILILWLPEFLEKEGNRLLKIIEEPPDNTVFLLVANNADRIINTLLSRLQLIKFSRLLDETIADAVADKFNLTSEQAKQIASMSDGNYNEAIQLLQLRENENASMLREWLECCYGRKIKGLFIWNDAYAKWGRENQKNFFNYCLHFFREIFLFQNGAATLNRLSEDELKMAAGAGNIFTKDSIMRVIELLDRCIYYIERNVNSKIMITHLSMEMLGAFQNVSKTKKLFFAEWEI